LSGRLCHISYVVLSRDALQLLQTMEGRTTQRRPCLLFFILPDGA